MWVSYFKVMPDRSYLALSQPTPSHRRSRRKPYPYLRIFWPFCDQVLLPPLAKYQPRSQQGRNRGGVVGGWWFVVVLGVQHPSPTTTSSWRNWGVRAVRNRNTGPACLSQKAALLRAGHKGSCRSGSPNPPQSADSNTHGKQLFPFPQGAD
jgi:hypothetical protein